jgi:hypothetical protein
MEVAPSPAEQRAKLPPGDSVAPDKRRPARTDLGLTVVALMDTHQPNSPRHVDRTYSASKGLTATAGQRPMGGCLRDEC